LTVVPKKKQAFKRTFKHGGHRCNVEQVQDDGLILTKDITSTDHRNQTVRNLTGSAGDKDSNRLFGGSHFDLNLTS
jgi:hypothetical protein